MSTSKTMRAIAAPMTARSTRCCASAPIVAPTSSTMIRRAASARSRRSPAGRSAAWYAGRTSPWPSARRYCRRRPRHRPRPSSPPRSRATSRICDGRRAAPGSACRPSSPRHRCGGGPGGELRLSGTRRHVPFFAVEEELEVRPALERDRGGRTRPPARGRRPSRRALCEYRSPFPGSDRPEARRSAAPGVGRDNSGFAAQGNARERPANAGAGSPASS